MTSSIASRANVPAAIESFESELRRLESEALLYEAFGKIPSIGQAWMIETGNGSSPTATSSSSASKPGAKVTLEISQKDVPQNAVRKSAVHFCLDSDLVEGGTVDTFPSICTENVVFTSPSPSGKRTLVVRKGDGDKGSSVVLQVWNQASVEFEVVVPEKLHGNVINDGWFGNRASWSVGERKVAYVAERPKGRRSNLTPEWGNGWEKQLRGDTDRNGHSDRSDRNDRNDRNEKDENEAKAKGKTWRGVGEFDEDWGEANTGKQAPAVYVLDLTSGTVEVAVEPSPDKSYGQPVWVPDGGAGSAAGQLAYVQWDHSSSIFPRMTSRLGIVYCFNRPCEIMICSPGSGSGPGPKKVETGLRSAFSPRFLPCGDMVFLSQENAVRSGTHSATPELFVARAGSSRSGTFDSVEPFTYVGDGASAPLPSDAFPGMYATVLPDSPAMHGGNGQTLLATVQWRSKTAVVAIDVSRNRVTRVSPEDTEGSRSWSHLGSSSNGFVMIQASAPSIPCEVYVQYVADGQQIEANGWKRIHVPGVTSPTAEVLSEETPWWRLSVNKALCQVETRVATIDAFDADTNPVKSFEATLISAGSGTRRPTLLVPHGGPHTAYSTQFIPSISFLVSCGYNVLTVNYRGSTGFGEASLQSLPGNIGTADVRDCMSALNHFIDVGSVDLDQVAVVGGSHGGFLSAHLIGQYPEVFKAAVMRNPVCNISLMVHLSDIPDWCYIETFGSEEGFARAQTRNTREDMIAMELKSPVQYVDDVTAPVLMMLGACDRRVPMDDGKRYIARLKQSDHAPETRIIVFDKDEHGLVRPQTDYEQWITCVWWLRRHGCGVYDV